MRRMCAWCQTAMNDEPDDGAPMSHGICDACLELVLTNRTAVRFFLTSIFSPEAVNNGGRGTGDTFGG